MKCLKCGELMGCGKYGIESMVIFMIWELIKKIFQVRRSKNNVPFETGKRDKMTLFKCKKCGCEEEVPDFVAFEWYTSDEFDKKSGGPIVLCIKCDSDMIIKKWCHTVWWIIISILNRREILFFNCKIIEAFLYYYSIK